MWKTVLIFSNHHIILIIVTPTTRCDLLFPQYPCHCHQLVARYHQHDSKLGFFQPPSGGIQSGSLIWGNLSLLPSPRLRREWNFRSLPQSPVLPGHFLSARQNPLTILQSLLPHFSLFYPQFTIFYPKSIGNTSNSLILPEYNFFTLTPPFYKSPPSHHQSIPTRKAKLTDARYIQVMTTFYLSTDPLLLACWGPKETK